MLSNAGRGVDRGCGPRGPHQQPQRAVVSRRRDREDRRRAALRRGRRGFAQLLWAVNLGDAPSPPEKRATEKRATEKPLIVIDKMRGQYRTWTRIRVNLEAIRVGGAGGNEAKVKRQKATFTSRPGCRHRVRNDRWIRLDCRPTLHRIIAWTRGRASRAGLLNRPASFPPARAKRPW